MPDLVCRRRVPYRSELEIVSQIRKARKYSAPNDTVYPGCKVNFFLTACVSLSTYSFCSVCSAHQISQLMDGSRAWGQPKPNERTTHRMGRAVQSLSKNYSSILKEQSGNDDDPRNACHVQQDKQWQQDLRNIKTKTNTIKSHPAAPQP